MNPVLILTHNCLELTKKCVESATTQDVDTEVLLWDNASTDGTGDWMRSIVRNSIPEDDSTVLAENVWGYFSQENRGVSAGWNWGINYFFSRGAGHVLVANNDTILPRWFLSSLLSYDAPFVTGISVNTIETIAAPEPRRDLAPGPDFSAFLIRRDAWEKIGSFDESMKHYASDLDYHIRAHRKGVRLMNAGVPFYHERSSTLKNSTPKERRIIELQADADRETLREKWGCVAWDSSYAAMFDDKLFGVDA